MGANDAYYWDSADRLTKYDGSGTANDTAYTYAPGSWERVKRTRAGASTYSLWDGDNLESEYLDDGTRSQLFVMAGLDEQLSTTTTGGTYYYLHDGLGSVRNLINTAETVTNTYDTRAYGQDQGTQTSGATNPFRYTGAYYDSWQGPMYHMRNRSYLPGIGLFASRDAMWADPAKGWAYVYGNPLSMRDPYGLGLFSDLGGIFGFGPEDPDPTQDSPLGAGARAFGKELLGMPEGIVDPVDWVIPGTPVKDATRRAANAIGKATGLTDPCECLSDSREYGHGKYMGPVVLGLADLLGGIAAGAKAGAGARAAADEIGDALGDAKGICFVAGTEIMTPSGRVKIEDVKVGDEVLAWDEASGGVLTMKVSKTFEREVDEVVEVRIGDTVITATAEHPFYVTGKGWVAAEDLAGQDRVQTRSGKDAPVSGVVRKTENCKVYNIEVPEYHAYFVGGTGVLVHNGCAKPGKPTSPNQLGKQVERGQAPKGVERVDAGRGAGQDHIHFDDGTSMNRDGTVHDARNGTPALTNDVRDWLRENGWL